VSAGATVCSIPAFHQAYIANGTARADRTEPEPGWNEDGTPKDNTLDNPARLPPTLGGEGQPEGEAVAASAWTYGLIASAAAAPRTGRGPTPTSKTPGWTEPTRHHGRRRRAGVRVPRHLGGLPHRHRRHLPGAAGVGLSNYAHFATGYVETDQGRVSVGQLTMDTGHAPMNLRARAAASHYDNTGSAVADVAMGQNAVGIWFAGRLRPGTTPEQVYAMRATGSVSGDWRGIGGNLELVAALVVNVNGFPIPTAAVAASAGGEAYAMVASGIVRPAGVAAEPLLLDMEEVTTRVVATIDRRARAHAAHARLRDQAAATARRRLAAGLERDRQKRVAAAVARIGRV
jgi:hypothetical protein